MPENQQTAILEFNPVQTDRGLARYRVGNIENAQQILQQSHPSSLLHVLARWNETRELNNERLAEIIDRDVTLAGRLLGRANSAAFRGREEITTTALAINRLGRPQVRQLLLEQLVFELAEGTGERAGHLLAHTLVTAEIAHALGLLEGPPRFAQEARLAALLHDVGKFLMLQSSEVVVEEIATRCLRESLTTRQAEQSLLQHSARKGLDHAALGGLLLEAVHVPAPVVHAVRHHHDLDKMKLGKWRSWDLTGLVHLADLLARRAGYTDGLESRTSRELMDPVTLNLLGVDRHELDCLVGPAIQAAENILATLPAQVNTEALELEKDRLRSLLSDDLKAAGDVTTTMSQGICCLVLDRVLHNTYVTEAELLAEPDQDDRVVGVVLSFLLDHGFLTLTRDSQGPRYFAGARLGHCRLTEILDLLATADPTVSGQTEPRSWANIPHRETCEPVTPRELHWSPRGTLVAVRTGPESLAILDGRSLELRADSAGRSLGLITDLSWVRDESHLLVSLAGGRSLLLDLELNPVREGFCSADSSICCVDCHPKDSRVVALGLACGQVVLCWHKTDGTLDTHELSSQHTAVHSLAWNPEGTHLATAGANGIVRIWDAQDSCLVGLHAGHDGPVQDLVWTADGRLLISAGSDGTVRAWNLPENRDQWAWRNRLEPHLSLAVSADGQHVLSTAASGEILVMRLSDGVVQLREHFPGGFAAAMHPRDEACLLPGTDGLGLRLVENLKNWVADRCEEWYAGTGVQIDALVEKMRKKSGTIRFLHVSDLHLGARQSGQEIADRLVRDSAKVLNGRPLDAIVICGDLANTADPEEYQTCWEFLDRLHKKAGLERDDIVLVPGNHDLNWQATPCPLSEEEQAEARDNGGCGNEAECARDFPLVKAYRQRFKNFSDHLYRRFFKEPFPLDYAHQGVVRKLDRLGLQFVGYNTSWEIDGCHKQRASIHGGQAENILQEADKDLPTIALWHHPISDLGACATDFRVHLQDLNLVMGLHGHIHQNDRFLTFLDQEKPTLVLAAGSLEAQGRQLEFGKNNTYSVMELDLEQGRLTVHSRIKRPGGFAWRDDPCWETERQGHFKSTKVIELPRKFPRPRAREAVAPEAPCHPSTGETQPGL